MSEWERLGATDEWYTPAYVFEALGLTFDLDVAAPVDGPRHVPCKSWLHVQKDGLTHDWHGLVWMNAPFGGRNGLKPWLDRFVDHRLGIALTPDRTSAPWFPPIAKEADAVLFMARKVKFERPDGSLGLSPRSGTALFAFGPEAVLALRLSGLGVTMSSWREAA